MAPRTVFSEDVTRILGELKSPFEARSEFLEICLRTGKVPVLPPGRKLKRPRAQAAEPEALKDILQREDWETVLLDAINAYALASKPPPNRAPSKPNGRSSGIDPAGETHATPLPRRQVDAFLAQHLLHFFSSEDSPAVKPEFVGVDSQHLLALWEPWLQRTIIVFFDATLLEIMSLRPLSGRIAVDSYNRTIRVVREYYSATRPLPTPPDPLAQSLTEAINRWDATRSAMAAGLPAQSQIERRLLRAPASEWREILWGFIRDWRSTLATIGELLGSRASMVVWIRSLLHEVRRALEPNHAGLLKNTLQRLQQPPTGGESWFFDPDRLKDVVEAVTRVRDVEKSPPAGLVDAQTVLRARKVFLDTCIAGASSAAPLAAAERTSLGVALDLAWWRSFAVIEGGRKGCCHEFCVGDSVALRDELRSDEAADLTTVTITPSPVDGKERAVVVFGAGIAGLTAAHELAERGFRVLVVERVSDVKRRQPYAPKLSIDGRQPLVPPPPAEAAPLAEQKPQVGGVARTQTSQVASAEGPQTVYGEHGYRLFPSFYRHVFDTMKRTPLHSAQPGVYPTAFDQLQPTYQQVFARRRQYVPLSRERPRTLEAFRREYMQITEGLGFERRDLARFFLKLLRYLMTSSERREVEYERITFMDFIGGPERYSQNFIDAVRAAPQALVAMDAEHCDARTQCNVYLQLLMDQVLGGPYTDSTLVGPTSKVWLDPWKQYLETRGVTFLRGELVSVSREKTAAPTFAVSTSKAAWNQPYDYNAPDGSRQQQPSPAARFATPDYVVVALDPVNAERVTASWDSRGVPSDLRGFGSQVKVVLPPTLRRHELVVVFDVPESRGVAYDALRAMLARIDDAKRHAEEPMIRSAFGAVGQVVGEVDLTADGRRATQYRVILGFAQRVGEKELKRIEDAAERWLDRGQSLRLINTEPETGGEAKVYTSPRLPADTFGRSADDRFQTFTGAQFYFAQDFKLVRGHVYFPDTEWGLSAVSQGQFWRFPVAEGAREIRGVLSVDIGACNVRSSYTRKTLMESSPAEILDEVWRQVSDALRTTRGVTSAAPNLPLPEPVCCHLDENLEFAGPHLHVNRSPFLINNKGDWQNRPKCAPWVPGQPRSVDTPSRATEEVWQAPHGGYRVHNGSVVFCGHYMRTFTRMTTMEAANESARHAVNAILDHIAWTTRDDARRGVSGDYCQIWDIEQHELEELAFFKRVDALLFRAGKPHMADILQLDRLADLQHPAPTDAQALLASVGATSGRDWGVQPLELVAGLNGLLQVVSSLTRDYGGATLDSAPLKGLMSLLGLPRTETRGR
ncbi:MAG: NAD(P)-binding protein [Polyangiales bacterium]